MRFLTLVVFLTLTGITHAQNVNIPDVNFMNALLDLGVDVNDDGQISNTEAETTLSLDVTDKSISDLTGIEAFTNLQTLVCDNNQLTSLDVSQNTSLYYLYCNNNQIPALDVSGNTNLIYLYCTENKLTNLDASSNVNLTLLGCWNNMLTSLDVSGCSQLQGLYCNNNQLTGLDISNNPLLNTLYCNVNQLNDLDLSSNQNLTEVYCGNNQLAGLDLSANSDLNVLFCNNNQLTSLDIFNNPGLTDVNCLGNQLTGLDCSGNPALTNLDCSGNQLTSLNVSGCPELNSLACYENNLTGIDLSNNPDLTILGCWYNDLLELDVSNNPNLEILYCGGNSLTGIDISSNLVLTEFSCHENQLSSLDVSNNPVLLYLDCSHNALTSLDLMNNTVLLGLNISGMPGLGQVCVSSLPFPPDNFELLDDGSPEVVFTVECSINEPPPCTTHDEFVAGEGFRIERDLSYFPDGQDLLKYIQRGDVIALSARITDKDYIKHLCICNGDTTSTLHGPYTDNVYYVWELEAGSNGKLIIPDESSGTVFYELPTCISEKYTAKVNLTVKNGENSLAMDKEITAAFIIEVEPCPLVHQERDGSVPAGWGGLTVYIDKEELSNGEDMNQETQENALCFPEDIVFETASDIEVNGEIKVSKGDFCKPDFAVLVTADADDLDKYKLKCQGEGGCESTDSLVKTIHDPLKYEWSIISGKGEFPLGNTGKSVVFHKSRSSGADLKCVISNIDAKANDGTVKELYISLKAADKPKAFVGLGDDEETFSLYKYFYESATGETIYTGRISAFMSAANSMKSSLENAGYEVDFFEYVSRTDIDLALLDPLYQAIALVGHGASGKMNMAGRDERLGTQQYSGINLIAKNQEAYNCQEHPRIRDFQLIGCEALLGNWSSGLHCGARLHGWKTTKSLAALRYYAFWDFTPLPPVNLSLE